MTIGEWLAMRTPAPPPQLMHRVRAALGDAIDDDARWTTDRCVDAAERVVAQLLREGRTGRESAPDLLAADALVAYAFEATGEDPARLVERAHRAMVRLAGLGTIGTSESSAGAVSASTARRT
jgi:uncharacterized membrane protein